MNGFWGNKCKWILTLMITVLVCAAPLGKAYAQGLSFYNYNTNKYETYNGTQVKYVFNNKELTLEYPGIIIDGIALADAKGLFSHYLGFSVSYNELSNQIAISDGKTTILMSPGSQTALVNGESRKMNAVPLRLKFSGTEEDTFFVPTRFVCQTFGYTYVWTSSTSTVNITKTLNLSVGGKEVNYIGTFYSVRFKEEMIELGQMPIIVYDNAILVRAQKFCDAIGCSYEQNGDEITIKKGGITILFYVGKDIFYVNGKSLSVPDGTPCQILNRDTQIPYIYLPLEIITTYLGYDLTYNDSEKQYTVLECERTGKAEMIEPLLHYEEGNTPVIEPSVISNYYFEWSMKGKFEEILENRANAKHSIYNENLSTEIGSIYVNSAYQSTTDGVETFTFGSTTKLSAVETEKTADGLLVIIPNATTATDGKMALNFAMTKDYHITNNVSSKEVSILFSFTEGRGDYEYSLFLDEEKNELSLKIYPDYLTEVTAFETKYADVLKLSGVSQDKIQMFWDNGTLIFDMPTIFNCIESKYYGSDENMYLKYVFLTTVAGGSRLQFKPQEGHVYYLEEKGNHLYIYFTDEFITLEMLQESVSEAELNLPEDKLILPLPEGTGIADISDVDNYLNQCFSIYIRGDVTKLLEEKGIQNPYYFITNYTISYDERTNYTAFTFYTSEIYGYKYEIFENYLIITVDKPSKLFSKIVLLDAGHGGGDPGAIYNGVYEKTLNFMILNGLLKDYFMNSDIKVYYTRETDVLIDLYSRAAFAKKVEADLFVSLHMNASTSASVKGTQVFYSKSNNATATNGLNSSKVAKVLVEHLCKSMGTTNRGANTANYVVIKQNSVPAVLIELGFMSNASDFAKLTDSVYQQIAAKTIYESIVEIFETYPTRR